MEEEASLSFLPQRFSHKTEEGWEIEAGGEKEAGHLPVPPSVLPSQASSCLFVGVSFFGGLLGLLLLLLLHAALLL